MLNKANVEKQEEALREMLRNLPDEKRKQFYAEFKNTVKDPDTYAVLNYFFVAGLHHFYLRKWFRGTINLTIFLIGFFLLFTSLLPIGIFLLATIFVVELYALFRSQLIVQDYNNKETEKILNRIEVSKPTMLMENTSVQI